MTDVAPTGAEPVAYSITIDAVAAPHLDDLDDRQMAALAQLLTITARVMRSRMAGRVDRCLNRPTCDTSNVQRPCCLICCIGIAVTSLLRGADDANRARTTQTGVIARELLLDVAEANPHHGGHIFLCDRLADYIRAYL
jgi:hypothetical protein